MSLHVALEQDNNIMMKTEKIAKVLKSYFRILYALSTSLSTTTASQ